MDILTHILSGTAAGTVVAGFSRRSIKEKIAIIAVSTAGGGLPDIDAVSLWSKFDGTIGRIFNLAYTGKEIYSAKFWYSHHAFMHSVFSGVMIAAIAWLIYFLLSNRIKSINFSGIKNSLFVNKLLLAGFLAGYFLHLIGDLPTPSSTWGGIRMFFPFKNYVGGSGDIWWWNNYDITLIVCAVIALNVFSLACKKYLKNKVKYLIIAVFTAGCCLSIHQVKTRGFDFAYSGYTQKYREFEIKSKEIQRAILGDKIYKIMEKIDNKLPIYF